MFAQERAERRRADATEELTQCYLYDRTLAHAMFGRYSAQFSGDVSSDIDREPLCVGGSSNPFGEIAHPYFCATNIAYHRILHGLCSRSSPKFLLL